MQKDVIGYEGLYKINDSGTVFSINRKIYLKPFLNNSGYYRVNLRKNGSYKKHFVHRIVADNFIDNNENKNQINHINGIKTDNSVNNLEWSSRSDNQIHAYKTGLQKPSRGEINGHSLLKEKDVLEIRDLLKSEKASHIAKKYGVKTNTIYSIKYRISWRHL